MTEAKGKSLTLPPLDFKENKSKFGSNMTSVKISDCVDKYDPLIFCRTCANVDPCLVPIFKEEGLNYNLNKKIEKYLPIRVSQEDDLPVHLCYHCASTLIAWDTLIVGCTEAEKKLNLLKNSMSNKQSKETIEFEEGVTNESIDSDDEPLVSKKISKSIKEKKSHGMRKCDEQRDISEEKTDFQTPLEGIAIGSERKRSSRSGEITRGESNRDEEDFPEGDDSDEEDEEENGKEDIFEGAEQDVGDELNIIPKSWLNIISCKNCGKISCAPKHLRQHERRGTCGKNYRCDDCGQFFGKESNFTKHRKRHRKDEGEPGEESKRFACSVCNRKFKFEDNGLAHEKICGKTESTHKCSVCGKRFETKTLADQHWTCHHKSRVCHMCGQSFTKPESLKQHVKTVHEEFKMVCHYCGKEFSRKARLQEHLQHHTGKMDFTCHVCGKGSTNAYSFGVHLATHSQETPYTCSFCPRMFKHMKYVYLHERSVHLKLKSGKTYVKPKKPGKNVAQRTCPSCNKTFKRESAMLIHKRSVHEGKNGYVCKLCGKDFKYTYLLYVHKKKHHFPELCKYVCEFCEKPFPVKTELQNHLRKHTGEKPYACGFCGKTYSFHGSLNMHVKTQHENKKNFKCAVCGSSYNFQSHLARHMVAHGDKFQDRATANTNL